MAQIKKENIMGLNGPVENAMTNKNQDNLKNSVS